ncbi:MAG TPA: hypothetical protein VI336_00015 [Candidatus Saccharimonadales bacterium]|nr:hypothetical protein [Candidatus Saccharimonadales bacterium]
MASKLTQKTTIYLEPRVKRFLQLQALQKSTSISAIINSHFFILMQEFEKSGHMPDGTKHPSLVEWEIVKKDIRRDN